MVGAAKAKTGRASTAAKILEIMIEFHGKKEDESDFCECWESEGAVEVVTVSFPLSFNLGLLPTLYISA